MAMLLVNNVEFPIHGEPSTAVREVGHTAQAFDGSIRKTRQALMRDLVAASTLMSAATAFAWEQLINGVGEFWSFDSHLYGSKGQGPSVSSGCTIGANGLHGSRVAIGSGSVLTYPGVYESSYSVLVWRNAAAAAGAGNWASYLVRSDGAKWVDGVRNDAASTSWLTSTAGAVSLAGDGAARWYDELTVLPFLVPDAWPPSLHGLNALALAFSPLPKLYLFGTAVLEGGVRTVVGKTERGTFVQAGTPMVRVEAAFSEG